MGAASSSVLPASRWAAARASGAVRTGLVYQGAQTDLSARLADGQRVLDFVAEPAPVPLSVGQPIHLHLPADAFMPLARPRRRGLSDLQHRV